MDKRYIYYETLGELRKRVENAIAEYGENARYSIIGCYGAEGRVEEIKASGVESLIYIITDICSG